MKKKIEQLAVNWGLPVFTAVLTFLFLLVIIPKAIPVMGTEATKQETTKNNKEVLHYTAIGDSLTEGIGDSTKAGGFVPLVAHDLEKKYNLNGIEVDNFGKNGDRSDQILARVKKSKEIQTGLQTADFITVTVGGNDLMKVIKGDIFKLTSQSFNRPLKKYQKQVQSLFTEIRKYNKQAPIYVLGIYNPYYLYFPDITEMQEVVDNWNNGTKEIVENEQHAYFISINDLIYKGSEQGMGVDKNQEITAEDINEANSQNDLLFEEDVFHPNNLGYQLMANAVRDEVVKTSAEWLPKERNKK